MTSRTLIAATIGLISGAAIGVSHDNLFAGAGIGTAFAIAFAMAVRDRNE
ncbi:MULTISPECIES: hypothetical protein [unclassified Mesorhizobium]|nr:MULTISPECIES: hypothetical protein [unclassified Mesorhizobium]MBZ9974258.1 hypothetical protein [Mesorhizobium sp. BR-1-1-10]